ncbi:MAG: hypothetical protein L3J89_14070 [Gammaproteobacteria bacterium]|nr:hypothetical protein [Gammaproteobacteria bacterium]
MMIKLIFCMLLISPLLAYASNNHPVNIWQDETPTRSENHRPINYAECFAEKPVFDQPDQLKKPFREDSFWYRPIPSTAIYHEITQRDTLFPDAAVTNSQAPTHVDLDIISICYTISDSSMREVDILNNMGWSFPYRAITAMTDDNKLYTRRLSANACTSLSWKPNGNAAFVIVNPDSGETSVGIGGWRCAGGPILGFGKDVVDPEAHNSNAISGDGTERVPGRASRLTPLGGVIREGELNDGIHHAISITMPQVRFSPDPRFIWPARDSDNSWNDGVRAYRGSDPNYTMGTLLALPPGLAGSLALTTSQGRHIAQAAETYGMYILDSSGVQDVANGESATMHLSIDARAALNDLGLEIDKNTGLPASYDAQKVDANGLRNDILMILKYLKVISNNSPGSGPEEPGNEPEEPGPGPDNEIFNQLHAMSENIYDGRGTWGSNQYGYRMPLRDSYWRADVYGELSNRKVTGSALFAQREQDVISYLVKAQLEAGTGVFPFPADVNNPEFGAAVRDLISSRCRTCIVNGWVIRLPGQQIEHLYFDHGYALVTLSRYHINSNNNNVLAALRAAANWILDKPIANNIHYNSALIKGLSYAYKATNDARYREHARTLHRYGVYSGFLSVNGKLQAYARDEYNAQLEFHGYIVSGMMALLSILDSDDAYYAPLQSHLDMSISYMATQGLIENADDGEAWPGSNLRTWYGLNQFRSLTEAELNAARRSIELIESYTNDIADESKPFNRQKALYNYFVIGLVGLTTDIDTPNM